jgi:hypothetical protein
MTKLSREEMKKVMGGKKPTTISCQWDFVPNAPSTCNTYVTTFNCSMSAAQCISSANLQANSDALCFVRNSGCCVL